MKDTVCIFKELAEWGKERQANSHNAEPQNAKTANAQGALKKGQKRKHRESETNKQKQNLICSIRHDGPLKMIIILTSETQKG